MLEQLQDGRIACPPATEAVALQRTIAPGSSEDEQLNRIGQMLGDVGRDAAAKQLSHGSALRRADHEEIDSHRSGKIDNRCRSVLAHGIKRDYVDAALAAEFEHRTHDGVCFGIILPFGSAKLCAGCCEVNGHLLDVEHKERGLA